MPIRVAIAEDHPGIRDRLLQHLGFFEAVDVMLVAESGDALLADLEVRARSRAPLPQVVLMDIEMPGRDGIEATRVLKERHPDVEVLMQTVFEDEARIFAAIQAGASGYLLKDAGADAYVKAIEEVEAGGAPHSPLVARKLLAYVRQHEAPRESFSLTPRETDVLALLVDDLTEAAIADRLGVSPHTVRTHVKNLYAKLQVHSRAQVVRLALENRLV